MLQYFQFDPFLLLPCYFFALFSIFHFCSFALFSFALLIFCKTLQSLLHKNTAGYSAQHDLFLRKVGGGSAGSRDATGVRGEGEEIEGGDVEREEMSGDGEWKLFQHWFERNSVVKGTIFGVK